MNKTQHKKSLAALRRAITAAGGQSALARLIGKRQGHVSNWLRAKIPAENVLAIEKATGVSRHDLRPDIYPREDVPA